MAPPSVAVWNPTLRVTLLVSWSVVGVCWVLGCMNLVDAGCSGKQRNSYSCVLPLHVSQLPHSAMTAASWDLPKLGDDRGQFGSSYLRA